jgi:membrane protein required for colicin V production
MLDLSDFLQTILWQAPAGSYLDSYIRVIDIVLGAILGWGGWKGYKKGFVMEALSTIVFIISLLLIFYLITTLFFAAKSGGYMESTAKPTSFIFYFIGFIAVSLGINFMGRKIAGKIKYSIFDDLDKFLGLALGLIKYAIFLSTLIWLLEKVGYRMPSQAVADSQLYPLMLKFQPWLVDTANKLLPFMNEMFGKMENLLRDLKVPKPKK